MPRTDLALCLLTVAGLALAVLAAGLVTAP